MLSRGQSRKLKVGILSIVVFLVTTYLAFTYFSNLFLDSGSDEVFPTFDILQAIAPYTASFSLTLYGILAFIFGRESNKVLPKGFYSPKSWLDIVHDMLVVIHNNEIVFFEIEENQKASVQSAYQDGNDVDSLISLCSADKVTKIPLNEITNIYSEHNAHFVSISHGKENSSINFMTPLVKAHFILSLRKIVPNSLEYNKKKKTRLAAIMPTVIILLVMAGIGFYFGNFIVSLLLAVFGIFFIFPLLIKLLIDPPIVETWEAPEILKAEELSPTA